MRGSLPHITVGCVPFGIKGRGYQWTFSDHPPHTPNHAANAVLRNKSAHCVLLDGEMFLEQPLHRREKRKGADIKFLDTVNLRCSSEHPRQHGELSGRLLP